MTRRQWTINLGDWIDSEGDVDPSTRSVRPDDADGLAHLMVDAYRGTIDYDGETIEDARAEVGSFFSHPGANLVHSKLAEPDGSLRSACLVSTALGKPFVAYVMTHPQSKGKGVGTSVLRCSLRSLKQAGFHEVGAFITDGNVPSESMFRRVGAIIRPEYVFHVAETADWDARTDVYAPSAFRSEGFVHCSTADQLESVGKSFFAGRTDLVLLEIEAVKVGSRLVYEDLLGEGEAFPHIYMRIPVDAVTSAVPYSVA